MTGLVASDLRPLVCQLDPERASVLYLGEVRPRNEEGVPVGGDVPLPSDRQAERNVRARWTRGHRRRLHRVGDIAGICPDSELHRVRRHVANLPQDDERTCFQRWLDQRTCRGENGQRDAEGDGRQHRTRTGPQGTGDDPRFYDYDMTRLCASCGRELPPNSRDSRRSCSTACRVRAWHESNPAPEEPRGFTDVPLHWHLGGSSFLAGDYHAGYWRGPDGCPPECPGLRPPNTWSQTIPEGREGLSPRT